MASTGTGELAVVAIAIGENKEFSVRDTLDQRREGLPDQRTGVAGPESGIKR